MKNLLLSWVFWALLSRFRGPNSHLRKDRYRERQFGLCDVYSHSGHPAGGHTDRPRLRELAAAVQRLRENVVVPHPIWCRDRRFLDLLLPRLEARGCRARCSNRQAQRRLRVGFRGALLG